MLPPNSPQDAPTHGHPTPASADATPAAGDDIDLRSMFRTLSKARREIIGFTLIGAVIASLVVLVISPFLPVSTSTRIIFSFNGLEKGEYPDHSKFQGDDLRSPYVIFNALKQQGLDLSEQNQSKIRGALNIEGVIPLSVQKERDRQRAAGQTPPPYQPDEFVVTLTLPRKFPLSSRQRELLMNEIVQVYLQNFRQTYADMPLDFGNAFETLKTADYYEYELILGEEIDQMQSFLGEQIAKSPFFRSPTTNMTFSDLREQTDLFSQIDLNETLGLIYLKGLSQDRTMAATKMDYRLRDLADQESKAKAEEAVVKDLLEQAQAKNQSYVLGIKTQATDPRPQTTVVDQGLVDSLLANDAYNFLIRRALDAGLKVRDIEAQRDRLLERRKNMDAFLNKENEDQTAEKVLVQKSLAALEKSYDKLVDNFRKTDADYAQQQFANAVRYGSMIETEGILEPLAVAALVGAVLGFAGGLGLALLGVVPWDPRRPA
jgi:hypothetical protein